MTKRTKSNGMREINLRWFKLRLIYMPEIGIVGLGLTWEKRRVKPAKRKAS